jgi:hypothetical protein
MRFSQGENLRQFKTKTIFLIFLQSPLHFHTDWLIFEGLATKVNLNQIIQKMCCISAIELPMNMNKTQMIENSALIFENMSRVFINIKN